jgi:hypothetical protein
VRTAFLFVAALLIPAAALADTTWVAVGSPVTANSIPFWGEGYDSYRCQWLYYQAEINQAGEIVAIGLYSTSDAPAAFGMVTVSCCHTPLTSLTTSFSDNYGGRTPQVLLQAETLLVGTGVDSSWYYFPGTFSYNDTDNLIVEITWRGDAGGTERFYRNGNDTTNRRCSATSDTASTGSIDNVMGDYIRFGFLLTGVEERKSRGVFGAEGAATVVNGVLRLPASPISPPTSLFSLDGRRVLDLKPGTNDVSRLRPGVYFVRGVEAQPATKVVIAGRGV